MSTEEAGKILFKYLTDTIIGVDHTDFKGGIPPHVRRELTEAIAAFVYLERRIKHLEDQIKPSGNTRTMEVIP